MNSFDFCPRCSRYVIYTHVDQTGQHWVCPFCGRTDKDYKLTYDNKTTYKEGQDENDRRRPFKVNAT